MLLCDSVRIGYEFQCEDTEGAIRPERWRAMQPYQINVGKKL